MSSPGSWYARLVGLLPGPFRIRHGDEMIFAFEEDRKRSAPSTWRLWSDYARTFVREWLRALPWEAIVILLWNIAVLGLVISLRDYVMLALYALIAASFAATPVLRRLRQRRGTAVFAIAAVGCAVWAFFVPKMLFGLTPGDSDWERLVCTTQTAPMILAIISFLRHQPWHENELALRNTPRPRPEGPLLVAPLYGALLGMAVFSIVLNREKAAGAVLSGLTAFAMIFPLIQAIWRREDHFREFATIVYPEGR